jgi:hypothetical protein
MAFSNVLAKTTASFGGSGTGFGNVLLKPKSSDLKTSSGLYSLAVQSGLQADADRILADKGEENKKIFSGGFISDIFDGLNALQYGVVGLLKGKGFVEGVKTRQSWSDKDALGEFGIPGMIGGIALDIACDPLTYIAPYTILKKVGLVKKIKGLAKTAGATKQGSWLARKFIYRFGQDPIYAELGDRTIRNIATGQKNITELIKPFVALPAQKSAKLLTRTKSGSFIRTPLNALKNLLTEDELFNVSKSYAILDDLGKQAVDLGLLSKGTWEANLGEYIRNAYTKFELPALEKKGVFDFIKKGIKGKEFKARKALTLAERAELGEIKNPAYLMAKSMLDLNLDVENAKLFKMTAEKIASKTAKEGLKQLPDTQRLGALKGMFVPEAIFEDIQEITRSKGAWEQATGKIVAGFKYGKVILNPATHARNIISNKLLNWWKLGIGPWRADLDIEAVRQLTTKGKYYKEAVEAGMNEVTYVAQELGDLLGRGAGENILSKGTNVLKKAANKLGDIYQGEEKLAKMAAFIAKRKGGMGIDDAWKAAMSATFDYSQVTPFIRHLRTSLFGFPFITFTTKATPIAVETALKHPLRISSIGKIKQAIESQADINITDRERASEPSWIRDGFYIKLPIKDEYGRSSYFDLTYIIPFGDLLAGDFGERQISRETGIREGAAPALARKSPFFNFIKEITNNQDFYGNKIWRDGDDSSKQLGDLFRHLVKTYSPPLIADQLPGGYITEGKNAGQRRPTAIPRTLEAGAGNQYRTLQQEMLRNVGIKIQPINVDIQETYMEWEKQKALKTLLKERGVLSEFGIPYLPR